MYVAGDLIICRDGQALECLAVAGRASMYLQYKLIDRSDSALRAPFDVRVDSDVQVNTQSELGRQVPKPSGDDSQSRGGADNGTTGTSAEAPVGGAALLDSVEAASVRSGRSRHPARHTRWHVEAAVRMSRDICGIANRA